MKEIRFTQRQKIWQTKIKELAQRLPEVHHSKSRSTFNQDLWDFWLPNLELHSHFNRDKGHLSAETFATIFETLGEICNDNGFLLCLNAHLWTSILPLWKFGSVDQKQRFLDSLLLGKEIGGCAYSEKESGSSSKHFNCKVVQSQSKLLLTGEKSFVCNAQNLSLVTVYARFKGQTSVVLLTAKHSGYSVEPFVSELNCLKSTASSRIRFDQIELGDDSFLGRPGQGDEIFTQTMIWERLIVLAGAVGRMKRLLDQTRQFAQNRFHGKHSLFQYSNVQNRFAEMIIHYETARDALYSGAAAVDANYKPCLYSSLTKKRISDAYQEFCLLGIKLWGSQGLFLDSELSLELMESIASNFYSGTNDIQSNIIAAYSGAL